MILCCPGCGHALSQLATPDQYICDVCNIYVEQLNLLSIQETSSMTTNKKELGLMRARKCASCNGHIEEYRKNSNVCEDCFRELLKEKIEGESK